MRSEESRRATRSAAVVQHRVIEIRDGAPNADRAAEAIVDARPNVSPKAMAQLARPLGVSGWVETLLHGSPSDIGRLAPNWRPPSIEASPPVAVPESGSIDTVSEPGVAPDRKVRGVVYRRIKALAAEQALAIHYGLVDEFADGDDPIFPPGLKSEHLLESAVSRQFTSLGGVPKYKTVTDVAATLMYGLTLNHPFHNGNKRTALVSMIVLMDLNGLAVTASEESLYDFVLGVAKHALRPSFPVSANDAADAEIRAISTWIRGNSRRKEHVDPSVTWRELKKLLRAQGCELGSADRSQVEITRGRKRCVVDFDGDTREVHRGVIRKIRTDLELTEDDGCDSDVFFGYALPLDRFIMKHRTVLRRLADA